MGKVAVPGVGRRRASLEVEQILAEGQALGVMLIRAGL